MERLKKLCKKNTITKLLCLLIVSSSTAAYATDAVTPEDKIFISKSRFVSQAPYLLKGALPISLDFSRINNVLTVEVGGNPDDDSILFVAEYDNDGNMSDVSVINDVQPENNVDITGSAYERMFLWNGSDLSPLCKSKTTKCNYDIVEGKEGEWEVSADGHTLYNYKGTSTDVVIPNSYKGKRINIVENDPAIQKGGVSKVSDTYKYNIFNARRDITSLKISDGIQIIGHYAFANCPNITSEFDFPKSLNTVGDYSFYNCSKMCGNIDFSYLKRIYTGSFMNCSSLTGNLNLSNLQVLNADAFCDCKAINGTLTLPALPTIPDSAFYNCGNLTGDLIIPEGVVNISDFAFSNTSSGKLKSLSLPSTLKRIGTAAFQFQTGFANELILPEGLTYIGDVAFNHCTKFSNTVLNIPSTVQVIGGDNGVTSNTGYGSHVFYDSFKKTVAYNADGDYFKSRDGVLYSADMTRLVAYPPAKTDESFTVPDGVKQIDEMALGYSKIKNLTLPDSYELIEDVPANVINYMANNIAVALYHYNKIENIYFNNSNSKYTCCDGIVYSKDMKDLWYVPTNKTGIINIADGTENIKKGAFYIENNSTSAEKYAGVYIPASVKSIHSETIKAINKRPLSPITVDENNSYWTVSNNKLTKK